MKPLAKLKERAIVFAWVGVAVIAMALGACTDAQLAKFQNTVGNIVSAIHTVDAALKDVNATLYGNCSALVDTASAINDLSGQCSKAAPYTSVANSVIDNYCQTAAMQQNGGISTSISVTAKSVSAAKSTLSANKAACAASGG